MFLKDKVAYIHSVSLIITNDSIVYSKYNQPQIAQSLILIYR